MKSSWRTKLFKNIRFRGKMILVFVIGGVIPFFGVTVYLNNRAVSSQYFSKLDFYLLYVLLFAIIYGQQQAIFSALLATAGYCFRQMYDKTGFEVLLDYYGSSCRQGSGTIQK